VLIKSEMPLLLMRHKSFLALHLLTRPGDIAFHRKQNMGWHAI